MTFDPAVLTLAVPFLLLVLLYFERKRRREQNRADESAAERFETADPERLLQELLKMEGEDEAAAETSFTAFLRGAPTRRLTFQFIAEVYHGAIGVVLLAFVAVVIIRDAIANPIVADVLVGTVLLPLAIAWALRARRVRSASDRVRGALARVVRLHDLQYGAVVDQRWRVIASAGQLDRVEDVELAPLLLGPHGEAMRTYRALEWMPLPQVVITDRTEAIADRPSPTLVVVVFGRPHTTFDDGGRRLASISQAIHDEFGTLS